MASGIRTCHPERSRGIHTASALRTLVGVLVLLALAGACVPEDALTPKVPSTLSAALADVSHPALDRASGWFSGAGIVTPTIIPTRCPFQIDSGFFVCSPLTAGGLTLDQRFTLHNADGGLQGVFDEKTTTSLHLENAVSGIWAPNSDRLAVDGQQVLDLTGLGSTRHTLNGTSLTITTLLNPQGGGPPINTERKTTITDLVFPVVVADAPTAWPLSGTVDTRSRTITAQGDTSVYIATMRFDGSTLVTLTFTVPGGIRTCRVNITMLPPGGLGCAAPSDPPLGADLLP